MSGTIATSGIFHLITTANGKPAILMTATPTTTLCTGFVSDEVTGNLIGTITSPACGASSKEFVVSFRSSNAPAQEDELYTGVNYDLQYKTEGKSEVTAGLSATVTLKSSTTGTLECT